MLSRVVIKNFKSIGEAGVDLELKPLTLLVGPNGGGKSSILEAIAVVSQANITGRLTQFSQWEFIMHKPHGSMATTEVHYAPVDGQTSGSIRVHIDPRRGVTSEYTSQNPAVRDITQRLYAELQVNTFLLSSVRGNIPYTVNTADSPAWVGVHGESLLMLLAIIFGQRRYDAIADRIIKWASRFGIGGLRAGLRGNNQSGSDYLDSELNAVLDLALASSGARQILTVITQLFWAPEGSLLMIEEPEISLHPKAQIDVLEMFAEGIRDGKQIIATTHSLILLQALGYAVLKGWLTRDQIIVHHVEKRKGGTTATPLPLSKDGYIKNWVPSFSKVERQLLREWAKSLPRA